MFFLLKNDDLKIEDNFHRFRIPILVNGVFSWFQYQSVKCSKVKCGGVVLCAFKYVTHELLA